MTKKKKIEVIEITKPGDEYESYEVDVTPHDEILPSYVSSKVILQEPKITDVARLRAQKALEANVKRGKK